MYRQNNRSNLSENRNFQIVVTWYSVVLKPSHHCIQALVAIWSVTFAENITCNKCLPVKYYLLYLLPDRKRCSHLPVTDGRRYQMNAVEIMMDAASLFCDLTFKKQIWQNFYQVIWIYYVHTWSFICYRIACYFYY